MEAPKKKWIGPYSSVSDAGRAVTGRRAKRRGTKKGGVCYSIDPETGEKKKLTRGTMNAIRVSREIKRYFETIERARKQKREKMQHNESRGFGQVEKLDPSNPDADKGDSN